jgi:CBS domain-containing membrane protein
MTFSIAEIMTTEPETLGVDDSLETARDMMSQRGFRHIPIVDDSGALAGLVTQSDVLAASASKLGADDERPASEVRIGEFMTRDVATVDERAELRDAAIYLQRHKYGCLPVVTDGQLRGIVTDSDFVGVAINLLEQLELSEPDEL